VNFIAIHTDIYTPTNHPRTHAVNNTSLSNQSHVNMKSLSCTWKLKLQDETSDNVEWSTSVKKN